MVVIVESEIRELEAKFRAGRRLYVTVRWSIAEIAPSQMRLSFLGMDHGVEPRDGYTRYHACTSRNPGHVMELVTIFD